MPPKPAAKPGDITGRLSAADAPPLPEITPEPMPEPELSSAPTRAFESASLPPLEPIAAPIAPPPRLPTTRFAGEFLAYWERLRHGRPFPSVDEVDRSFIGEGWQDSMILDFAGERSMPHIARLGRASDVVEYMPLMTDWILSRGRQAARRGAALDEVQRFEGDGEILSFRLLLLPLGTHNGASDCVLCHLSRDL
ncbi:MAG TPA: hypothetical protein VN832_00150 [Stellaceae bacterium]|nr:hypothetical protein [Stellaceae bacterium]